MCSKVPLRVDQSVPCLQSTVGMRSHLPVVVGAALVGTATAFTTSGVWNSFLRQPHGISRQSASRHSVLTVASSASTQAAEPKAQLPALLQLSHRRAIWTVAWPAMAIGVLRTLYGVIDAFWIGKLGPVELEAMGAASFATWIILILGELPAVGVHAVSAAHEGSGTRSKVGPTVAAGLWISLFISLALAACLPLGIVHGYFELLGLGASGGTHAAAVCAVGEPFLFWSAIGALPLAAGACVGSGFKGLGIMRPALFATAVSVAFNAVVDPLFIWGCPMLGIPKLGVVGAAHATNLSALLALLLLAARFRKICPSPHSSTSSVGGGDVRRSWWPKSDLPARCLHVAKIGAPVAASGMLFTVVFIALGRLLTSMGPVNLAAMGIGQRLESLQYTVNEAFAASAATLVGQWLGAGKKEQARRSAWRCVQIAALINVPFMVMGLCFAQQLASCFANDASVAAAAAQYLKVVAVVFPLAAAEVTFEGALAGAGDTLPTLLIGLALNGSRVGLAMFLSKSGLGVNGVWLAIAATTVLKAFAKWAAFHFSGLPALRQPAGAAEESSMDSAGGSEGRIQPGDGDKPLGFASR